MTLKASLQSAGYGLGPVLRDIELDLPAHGMCLIAGRNGMGKSTLLGTLMGLIPRVEGTVRIGGHDPYATALEDLARAGIALMPQDGGVFDELSVEENLRLTRSRSAAEEVLSILPGWEDRMRQPAGTLSGGERKVLGLARAIGQQPTILLTDEPTEGVWHEHLPTISAHLDALSNTALVVVVEQNLSNLLESADTVLVMERGTVVLAGNPQDVAADPAIEALLSL